MKVQSFAKKQAGFTLIELIVVIVILGILAATAIPRFADMGKQAKQAAVAGMVGALQSASAIAHAQFLVKPETDGSVKLEGTTVTIVNGYPTADAAGIGAALSASDGFTGTAGTGSITYQLDKAGTNTCTATYNAATAAPAGGVIAPSITSSTTAC